jgi:hypothetical protein
MATQTLPNLPYLTGSDVLLYISNSYLLHGVIGRRTILEYCLQLDVEYTTQAQPYS